MNNSPLTVPEEWKSSLDELVRSPRRPLVVMVVGAPDVGKTSFCALLSSTLHQHGFKTAVVDTDMGQSDIGPPTTIGLGFLEAPLSRLSDVRYVGGYFVGSTSPVGHLLPTVVGAKRMVEKALCLGAEAVVIDTTGLVLGGIGRELKQRKIELLRPSHLVIIQHHQELVHLVQSWRGVSWLTVMTLPAPAAALEKSREMRRNFREAKFKALLDSSHEMKLALSQLSFRGTWFGQGRVASANWRKHLSERLGAQVLHAEAVGEVGVVIVDAPHDAHGESWVRSEWEVEHLIVLTPEQFEGIVVGLLGRDDELMQVGALKKLDLYRKELVVLAPPVEVSAIRTVVFGSLKLNWDGTERGTIATGSI